MPKIKRYYLFLTIAILFSFVSLGQAHMLSETHPNLKNVKIPGIEFAVRSPSGKLVFCAVGKTGVQVVDLKEGKIVKTISLNNHAASFVSLYKDFLFVSAYEKSFHYVYVLDVKTLEIVRETKFKAGLTYAGMQALDENRVALIAPGQTVHFIDTQKEDVTKEEIKECRDFQRGTLYGDLDFDFQNKKLYIPKGYPGGVVICNTTNPTDAKIVPVEEDWIHAAKIFGNKVFVAGHLAGIGWVDMESKKYTNLTKDTYASLYSEENRLFALTNGSSLFDEFSKSEILEINPSSGTIIQQVSREKETTGTLGQTGGNIIDVEGNFVLFLYTQAEKPNDIHSGGLAITNLNSKKQQ